MKKSWTALEDHVRKVASYIWGRDAIPQRIGGTNIDCVLKLNESSYVLIEITEERSLEKVRGDVTKLTTARGVLFHESQAHARCYCIVGSESITTGMFDAGKEQNVVVTSLARFERILFDFDSYRTARIRVQFGSAVNPVTGQKDDSDYTPVSYLDQGTAEEVAISGIAELLTDGRHIIMTGEYGSGKSRCVRELFAYLSNFTSKTGFYPIAIDLRENWGLKRATEIIRRHFDDLGLDTHAAGVLKALPSGQFIFLLDGFDELGFQSWSDDTDRLKNMRSQSLEGVRDLLRKTNGGVFICGREHYFNNTDEMFSSLGVTRGKTSLLTSKEEFSEPEMAAYMERISGDYAIPSWLPKRPLICQAIATLPEEDLDRIFGEHGGDIEFWHLFMRLLCERDARINPTFDADTIFRLLSDLSRITRVKSANVGPISLGEIQKVFDSVVGETPNEQASIMLQRLPGLGRVKAESNDRQFIDTFILDGLRAVDVNNGVTRGEGVIETVAWRNPLEQLGQRVLATFIRSDASQKRYMQSANRCASLKNRVLAGDIAASLLRANEKEVDFGGLAIDDGHFAEFDMTQAMPLNLRITNSIFVTLALCPTVPKGTTIEKCLAGTVLGVTSAKGLPSWVDVQADHYLAPDNVAMIRRLGLKPSQEIFVTIVRKTFFQKGSGRKEEALLRGLGNVAASRTANKILNVLIREGLLERFKGDEGFVYAPKRAHADRMQKVLAELNTSQDSVWAEISAL